MGHGKSYTASMLRAQHRGAPVAIAAALAVTLVVTATGCTTSSHDMARGISLREALASAVQVVVEGPGGTRAGSGVTIARRPGGAFAECFALTTGETLASLVPSSTTFVALGPPGAAPSRTPATVVALPSADDPDLALLRFESERCMPARGASTPALGDPVWAVGFPFGGAMTLAGGIVSQVAATTSDAPARLMIDAPVGYGTSGGGVYSETGALIGLVAGFTTARVSSRDAASAWFVDVPVPGQTLVTPLADVTRFLARHGRADLLFVRERAR